jgi:hypothetical protein
MLGELKRILSAPPHGVPKDHVLPHSRVLVKGYLDFKDHVNAIKLHLRQLHLKSLELEHKLNRQLELRLLTQVVQLELLVLLKDQKVIPQLWLPLLSLMMC